MFEYEWTDELEQLYSTLQLRWPAWLHATAEKVEMVPAKGNPKKLVRRIPEGAFFRDDAAADVWPRMDFDAHDRSLVHWWLRTAKAAVDEALREANLPEDTKKLRDLLEQDEDIEREVLPNGQIREAHAGEPSDKKPITFREKLGGEYSRRLDYGTLKEGMRVVVSHYSQVTVIGVVTRKFWIRGQPYFVVERSDGGGREVLQYEN